jgi:hypothetical protein
MATSSAEETVEEGGRQMRCFRFFAMRGDEVKVVVGDF